MSLSSITQRVSNQISRIDQGLQSGTLSGSQATGLAQKDLQVLQQAMADAAKNGGKLTPQENKTFRRELNHDSRDIFEAKHPHSVGARLERQHDRIAAGLKSGKLTPAQAQALTQKDREIRQDARKERAANGGKLTAQERAQLEQELNQNSKAIYQAKHPVAAPQTPATK